MFQDKVTQNKFQNVVQNNANFVQIQKKKIGW